MIPNWNKILKEWSYRVGVVKPNNSEHLYHLNNILEERGWPHEVINGVINNLTEAEDDKYVSIGYGRYKEKGKEKDPDADVFVKTDAGKYVKSSDQKSDDKGEKPKQAGKPLGKGDFDRDSKQPTPSKDFQRDMDTDTKTDEPISGISNIQSDIENKRDKGISGAGGAIASQGEARYCNAMNNYNNDNFKKENRELIDNRKEEFKNKKLKVKEQNDLKALGLEGDDGLEYLATREVYADKELERIKKDEDSVFYKKGKEGFNGKDEPYKEWMRAAYDGTLSTRKILEEDTDLDTSKPNTTMQSETEIDDKVEEEIQKKLDESSGEDKEYYEKELKSFQKFRKYHDTYTVGQDKNGRLHIVSISNKKGSDLRDPQNNTTPKKRFELIKDNYGNDVADTVTNSLNEGIERVSDTKQSAVNRGSKLEVTDSISDICELPKMQKYMDKLNGNKKFIEFVEKSGKKLDDLSTKEKLKLMQEHAKELIQDGKKPAYEPYGKIWTKIGEYSRTQTFKDENPNINFDDDSVNTSIEIKQDEKGAVNSAHKQVVTEISEADREKGFPKDGKNGPHIQGYISTVMSAMHFDSYIDGGDKKMIIQMGIRGAQPKDIRKCLAEQSNFDGDIESTDGRDKLKQHLKEKCQIDSESGAIYVESPDGKKEIAEDTWRTAGTSQKVASHFGSGMRDCIKETVDERRKS